MAFYSAFGRARGWGRREGGRGDREAKGWKIREQGRNGVGLQEMRRQCTRIHR